MIADISNKKLKPIAIALFIRGRNLNNWIVFMSQSHFLVPKKSTMTES